MRRETELLFDSIVREDRNVLDLLTANYTFVDERLAKHYGIPNVLGNRFRRVTLTDPNRFGLLGQGSILTLTSTADSHFAGAARQVGDGSAAGHAAAAAAAECSGAAGECRARTGDVAKPLSVRERMEEHRTNPTCAACHKLMDPIGFALENFDAVGVWRTNDSGMPHRCHRARCSTAPSWTVRSSLRQAILNHSDAFIGTFTENLLAYGMGRVLEYRDMPVVRAIERRGGARTTIAFRRSSWAS